jgi:hypothetical protein
MLNEEDEVKEESDGIVRLGCNTLSLFFLQASEVQQSSDSAVDVILVLAIARGFFFSVELRL